MNLRAWTIVVLAAAAPVRANESSSPHYSNLSLVGGPTAPAVPFSAPPRFKSRPIPRPAPTSPPPAARAPAPPAAPPAPLWPWTALGAALVFGAAARLRARQSGRDRAADETLAMAAHELKSPLAAIESYLDLMAHEAPEHARNARQWLEDVQHMKSTAAHLRRTIGDMLDMTRIEDGRVKLAPQGLAVGPLLTEAAAAYSARARERSVKLLVNAAATMPEVHADPDRLRQVVHNLLGNALKYTPAGKTVVLGAHAEGERVVVDVRDEGVGIPPEKRDRLFGKFQRLSPSLDGTEGTGLGLYISRRLVEAQGGRLAYSPGPQGRGSVFRIELPCTGED